MTNADEILNYLRNKEKNGFLYPQYDGYSLYNVMSTIFDLLVIKNTKIPLSLDLKRYKNKKNKIVFFLVDGFGFNQYKKLQDKIDFLKILSIKGFVCPITSGFPSTTSASLTTMATGLTPQEHGLFEWNLYMEELGEIIQTLPFASLGRKTRTDSLLEKGVKPELLINKPTIYEAFEKEKVQCYVFQNISVSESVYSMISTGAAKRISYRYLSDLISSLRKSIAAEEGPAFFYVYWSGIDSQGHEFSPNSEEYFLEAKIFFDSLQKEFLARLKKGKVSNTLFMMTSDHGQVPVDASKTIYLNHDEKLVEAFDIDRNGEKILPWGSPRDVFLAIKERKKEEIVFYLREAYGKYALILKTEDAVKAKLFGDGSPNSEFLHRLGNIMILPFHGNTIWYEHIKGELFEFKGHHGGLTEDEMLIPLAVAKFEDLI
ncbi:MAG: alkaline phosphatase family protein [Patescibacteria group bacterium]